MNPHFALFLRHDIIALSAYDGGEWSLLGRVELVAPDAGRQMNTLRERARAAGLTDMRTVIVLPAAAVDIERSETNRNVLRSDDDSRMRRDVRERSGWQYVASVQTALMREAEAFGATHGFSAYGVAAPADISGFPGMAWFGRSDKAGGSPPRPEWITAAAPIDPLERPQSGAVSAEPAKSRPHPALRASRGDVPRNPASPRRRFSAPHRVIAATLALAALVGGAWWGSARLGPDTNIEDPVAIATEDESEFADDTAVAAFGGDYAQPLELPWVPGADFTAAPAVTAVGPGPQLGLDPDVTADALALAGQPANGVNDLPIGPPLTGITTVLKQAAELQAASEAREATRQAEIAAQAAAAAAAAGPPPAYPTARPAGLRERYERLNFGGRTFSELAGLRPEARPASVQEAAAASLAALAPTAQAVGVAPRPAGRTEATLRRALAAQAAVKSPPAAVEPPKRTATAVAAPQPKVATARAAPSQPVPSATKEAETRTSRAKVDLIGTFGTQSQRKALLMKSNGRVIEVGVGDRLDGGRVATIGQTELRYTKGGRNYVLKMPRG